MVLRPGTGYQSNMRSTRTQKGEKFSPKKSSDLLYRLKRSVRPDYFCIKLFALLYLTYDVWDKRHKACTLYSLGQVALTCSGKARAAARHYFAVGVKKLLESLNVFVIHVLDRVCVGVFHN